MRCIQIVFAVCVTCVAQAGISFTPGAGTIDIRIDDKPFAIYRYTNDAQTPRPYFYNVHAPDGTLVTRTHPPDPVVNKDNADHETMHPGIWLAFGDVNGMDVWRNKARVRHVRFVKSPTIDDIHGTFTVEQVYEPIGDAGGTAVTELCQYDVYALDIGWYLIAQSVFGPHDTDMYFGDQEEMGFGVRVNTPLTVKFGDGTLLNSEGGKNEYGTWGQRARWCSAYGSLDGKIVGLTLMPGPQNFRQSWFHSRDYGLIVANPFGKKAMTAPDNPAVAPDSTKIAPGQTLRLAFGVFVFSGTEAPDNKTAYEWFQELLAQSDPPSRE